MSLDDHHHCCLRRLRTQAGYSWRFALSNLDLEKVREPQHTSPQRHLPQKSDSLLHSTPIASNSNPVGDSAGDKATTPSRREVTSPPLRAGKADRLRRSRCECLGTNAARIGSKKSGRAYSCCVTQRTQSSSLSARP